MKNAIIPRREVGVRTVFNILGPLTNPANASGQVLGVYDENLVEPMAKVLKKLGTEEALVVHGIEGLDEISTIGKTKLAWLKEDQITIKEISPQDLNLKQARPNDVSGFDVEQSAKLLVSILNGNESENSTRLQMVLANAAAAIVVGGKAEDLISGISIARGSIASGKAYEKLRKLIEFTSGDISKLERMEPQNA
jgi:anthranilate phosphoribosyltransferase